jgi:GT2 family glycosyltransferase
MQVTAIIVTYRRPETLASTLLAVGRQTRPVDLVVVVDNDPLGSAAQTARGECMYVQSPTNGGYAAGIALGMQSAPGTDAYWILDDDSAPDPGSLALVESQLLPGVGVAANRGGHLRFGRIRHDLRDLDEGVIADADFTLIDGAVVRSECVVAVGPPRGDFFMMMEDIEFTTRVKSAGYRLVVVGGDKTEHQHLGSAAPWRGYYQARNHLRICIERRSLRLFAGWFSREAATQTHLVRHLDRVRLRLRWAGVRDGLLNRMGRRHDV